MRVWAYADRLSGRDLTTDTSLDARALPSHSRCALLPLGPHPTFSQPQSRDRPRGTRCQLCSRLAVIGRGLGLQVLSAGRGSVMWGIRQACVRGSVLIEKRRRARHVLYSCCMRAVRPLGRAYYIVRHGNSNWGDGHRDGYGRQLQGSSPTNEGTSTVRRRMT